MTRILLVSLVIFLNGCASAEMGRLITPEQAAWIQKGITTRNEVVERFGVPDLEFPDDTDSKHQTPSTSTTTKEGDTGGTTTPTRVDSRKNTKATYLHTKSEAAVLPFYANAQSTQSQFWIKYDDNGIVQDFGFDGRSGLPVR